MWFLSGVWKMRGIRRYRDKEDAHYAQENVKKIAILETFMNQKMENETLKSS